MRRYRVEGPCPELGMVLAKMAAELAPGEEAVVESRWRYVATDLAKSAGLVRMSVVDVKEGPGGVFEIRVRKLG